MNLAQALSIASASKLEVHSQTLTATRVEHFIFTTIFNSHLTKLRIP